MNILSSFEQSLNVLPPNDLRRKIRVSGAELLREVGLPHRRLESFRYTSLRELGEYQFFHGAALVSEPMDFSPFLLPGCVNVVFVNGVLLHKDDFPSGLRYEVRNERKTSAGEASLDFLRQAYFNGTHSFVIESGAQIEKPIHLVNLSQTGGVKLALNSLEIHFALGEGARVTLLEQHCWGEASPHLSIPAISVETSRGAALNHVRVKKGQGAGLHLGAVT
ncbi:MAG: hypothetical protein N2578_00005, partial [Bdellovibrionaceae bacterium]|nr:hypothetical protein [Pseudobdellovibrionaceae bacterium]